MPRHIDTFTEGTLELSSSDAVPIVVEVSCQTTTVRLVATSSVETTPGVLCDPSEVDVPLPSKYTVEITYNQDNEQAAGISQFLWEHDAEQGTFTITNGPTDPSVSGECYFVAGDFGGDAGKPMTDSKVLNVIGKPDRTFGTGVVADPAARRSTETVDA